MQLATLRNEYGDESLHYFHDRHFIPVEDVAAAALFLAARSGSYITGETMHVNGGMLMP